MANDGSVEIKIVGDDSDLKKKLSGIGSAAQGAAKVAAAAIAGMGTALVGVGAYAVKVGSDFEAGMSKVAAISGATGGELAQLEAKAKEMGATTKFSATESAEALQYMAMAGWKTRQMVDGLPGIMNLAAASGENLASVSDIVTDALTAFGLQASDSAHFADVLAKASSSANTNVSMMGATFKYAAPLAGAMGYSIEDTALAIGLMANAGIKGEQAGTSLRTMFTKLSETAEGAGIQITDAAGKMLPLSDVLTQLREKFAGLSEAEQIETATNLVGQEAMSGLLAIVNASASDYDKLADAIAHADGAAKQQADTMNDNLKGALTLLGSNLEGVGIQIYDSLETPLKQAVQSANGSITTLSRSLSSGQLRGAMQTVSKAFGSLVESAADLAACALPKLVTGFAGLVKNADKVAVAVKLSAAAFVALKTASVLTGVVKGFQTAALQVALFTAGQTAAATASGVAAGALTAQETIVGVLTGKVALATAAQAAWNAVMAVNPIMLTVVAVGALVAAVAGFAMTAEKGETETSRFNDRQKELTETLDAQKAARENLRQATAESMAAFDAEIGKVEGYIRELDSYTDQQGKVADAHKARADYLMNEINNLIPGAVEKLEDEAGAHYQIIDSIEAEILAKKKAALLDAMQEEYAAALAGRLEAQNALTGALGAQTEAQAKLNDAKQRQAELEEALSRVPASNYTGWTTTIDGVTYSMEQLQAAYEKAGGEVSTWQRALETSSATVEQAKNGVADINDVLELHNAATGIETMAQFDAVAGQLSAHLQQYSAEDAAALQQSTADTLESYRRRAEEIAATYVEMDALHQEQANSELATYRAHLTEMANAVSEGSGTLMAQFAESLIAGEPDTQAAMQLVRDGVITAADATAALQAAGYAATEQYAGGIAAAEALASGNAAQVKTMCDAALAGDTSQYGYNFMRGFLEAILASNPSEDVRAMIQGALDVIPATQASNSPSKITEGYGGDFAEGYTEGIKGGVGAAETAAGSMAQRAIAKLLGIAPQAKQGGTQVTGNFTQGVSGGTPGALSAVSALAQQAAEKLLGIVPAFQTGGQQAVSQMQQGVEGNAGAAVGAVQSMANRMLSSARNVASSFVSVGTNMAQGLMNGISQMASRVASTAANLAKSALSAAKSAVGIQSPSRDFREQVGRMMGMGMALGIGDSKETVKANIAMLSQMALEDARDKAKDFKEVGDLYIENLTYGVEKGRDAALDKFERWLDEDVEKVKARKDATDEQKKSYEGAAKEVMSAYKDALNDGYDEALSTVKTRVSELTTAFKTQHDALVREQESMRSKLAGFGDLFNIDKFGNLSLENIDKSIDAIERYDEALSALKDRGVSEDFMQQVTALGVEEGTKFAEKLANLPDEAFANYTAAWQEQQDKAKEIAQKFYADQLETLEADFAGKLDETLESVPNLLTNLGQDSIQGMIDGMYSKSGMLSAAASEIVSRAIRAMQAAADVNSPSKKTRDLVGKPLAEGIAVGFDRQMADVYRQVSQTLDGEILKLSADVKVQVERQAAKASLAPVQTVVKSTHTDRIAKITVDESKLNRLGRAFYDVIKIEEKRRGDNMVKGAT